MKWCNLISNMGLVVGCGKMAYGRPLKNVKVKALNFKFDVDV